MYPQDSSTGGSYIELHSHLCCFINPFSVHVLQEFSLTLTEHSVYALGAIAESVERRPHGSLVPVRSKPMAYNNYYLSLPSLALKIIIIG